MSKFLDGRMKSFLGMIGDNPAARRIMQKLIEAFKERTKGESVNGPRYLYQATGRIANQNRGKPDIIIYRRTINPKRESKYKPNSYMPKIKRRLGMVMDIECGPGVAFAYLPGCAPYELQKGEKKTRLHGQKWGIKRPDGRTFIVGSVT